MKKFFLFFVGLFLITFSLSFAETKADHSSEKVEISDINTDHLVYTKILYDEIYDIDISEGHYRASVEVLLSWEDKKTEEFSKKINDAINSVAETQNKASQITKDYELGKETDLTKVIMQQQISNIAFQMTLNVRNKVLSSYKDIMNMPV